MPVSCNLVSKDEATERPFRARAAAMRIKLSMKIQDTHQYRSPGAHHPEHLNEWVPSTGPLGAIILAAL